MRQTKRLYGAMLAVLSILTIAGCRLLDIKGTTYSVELAISGIPEADSRGITGDEAVDSVSVVATDSGDVQVGSGALSKDGSGVWRTVMSIGAPGLLTFAAEARDIGSNVLYQGSTQVNITGVGDSVLIPMVKAILMITIPGGTFQMGSTYNSDEQPEHTVMVSSFMMNKYEVTQSQYQTVMGTNPSWYNANDDAPDCPVEQVSWYDVLVFCNRLSMQEGLTPVYTISGSTDPSVWGSVPLTSSSTWNAATMNLAANGYRLPTEAEWEYATRGGTTTTYYWGESTADETISPYEWYAYNSTNNTHGVGQKTPNAYGLCDMLGNVSEWCWDWFGTYPSEVQTDPVGPFSGSYRILRGGSIGGTWATLRSAYRDCLDPEYRSHIFGFRVVRRAP